MQNIIVKEQEAARRVLEALLPKDCERCGEDVFLHIEGERVCRYCFEEDCERCAYCAAGICDIEAQCSELLWSNGGREVFEHPPGYRPVSFEDLTFYGDEVVAYVYDVAALHEGEKRDSLRFMFGFCFGYDVANFLEYCDASRYVVRRDDFYEAVKAAFLAGGEV